MPVTVAEYQEIVRRFFIELDRKTGWGKNELKELWGQMFNDVLSGDEGEN